MRESNNSAVTGNVSTCAQEYDNLPDTPCSARRMKEKQVTTMKAVVEMDIRYDSNKVNITNLPSGGGRDDVSFQNG